MREHMEEWERGKSIWDRVWWLSRLKAAWRDLCGKPYHVYGGFEAIPYMKCQPYRRRIASELSKVGLRLITTNAPRPRCGCAAHIGEVVSVIADTIDEDPDKIRQMAVYLRYFEDWRERGERLALDYQFPETIEGLIH